MAQLDVRCIRLTLTRLFSLFLIFFYGQSRILCRLKIRFADNTIFHPITWSSHKQRKISYSPFGSEILVVADGDDRGFHIKQTLISRFPYHSVRHKLLVDLKSLFEIITTLHNNNDYRLRLIVARLRDSFEAR